MSRVSQHTLSKTRGRSRNPQSFQFYSGVFRRRFKIFFNMCLFVFISFTLMHTLVIFFLPPTINLISQPSSRSFSLQPPTLLSPLPVQAEMREGLRRKGKEGELKQDAGIKYALTVFDCFLHYFLRVDLKQGWAASWISYSLLSVFIYNSTYLQITGGTSAPTLAPNLRSDVLQYTI